ncbi:NAD(P)H-dependent flavin oxidoreductase [Brevibacterium aurantiacum]|uniref:2-nitropropane dioxygenase n=1 Tax=Brevibacterium aurantiacum TaxID=273384 RepID=A0A4Z0KEI8_BREAU|nr:nitronate monooxygenase [Brevibacterium aurantiacum]TGD37046.1 2-nitropropane dioxygenase [Brevibacterium aurantiacum]
MSALSNRYTELVGIEYPIVQEGLGPFTTAKIAAAVSQAGGLGTISMPGMPEDLSEGMRTLRSHIEQCAELTDKPFAVNLPVGVDHDGTVLPFTDTYIRGVLEARKSDAALEKQLTVLTTSAGFPGEYCGMIKDAGLIHQHKVGSTHQARKSEDAGVDVVIAAGFEMGGHAPASRMHTFVLVPNITESISVPVLLTGGARDGRGLAAALALGAEGVALGTRFIVSEENEDWHPHYLQAILDAAEGDDVAFTGVYGPCRGLRNEASRSLLESDVRGDVDEAEKIRSMQRAQSTGDTENGLVLAGQVAASIHEVIRISEFVPQMADEAAAVIEQLAGSLQKQLPGRVRA